MDRAKQEGCRVGIASSAQKRELNGLLDVAGVRNLFEEATTS